MDASIVIADKSSIRGISLPPNTSTSWELPLPETPFAMASLGERIVAATATTVTVIDENHGAAATRGFSHVGSIAEDRGAIFVGADGCLFCLSENLEELSWVDLGFGEDHMNPNKNVDDILIYKDVAYLLDDIMAPMLIFKANVSDFNNISITETGEKWGVNSHLSLQLVNPELDQWIIKEDTCHQGGSAEALNFLRLHGRMSDDFPFDFPPPRPLPPNMKERTVFEWSFPGGAKGYRIMDVLPFPPHWAVVLDTKTVPHLAKLNTRGEKPRFSYLTPLYDAWPESSENDARMSPELAFKIRRQEDQLYVLPVTKRTEWGFCTAEQVALRLVSFDVGKKRPRKTGELNLLSAGIKEARNFLVLQ